MQYEFLKIAQLRKQCYSNKSQNPSEPLKKNRWIPEIDIKKQYVWNPHNNSKSIRAATRASRPACHMRTAHSRARDASTRRARMFKNKCVVMLVGFYTIAIFSDFLESIFVPIRLRSDFDICVVNTDVLFSCTFRYQQNHIGMKRNEMNEMKWNEM